MFVQHMLAFSRRSYCFRPPYAGTKRSPAGERIEAACLARLFAVSWLAMQVRLEQLGFVEHEDTKEAGGPNVSLSLSRRRHGGEPAAAHRLCA